MAGMFGRNQTFGSGYDPTTGTMSVAGASPTASPSFFAQGGVGRNIAGYLGDALIGLGGGKAIYGPHQQQQAEMQQRQMIAEQQQQAELARQLTVEQYKREHPTPGSVETNYNFINSKNPQYGQTYLAAMANPQTLASDPATGNVRFVPKAGEAGMGVGGVPSQPPQPVVKVLPNGQTVYWVNGAWYDNPEGRE